MNITSKYIIINLIVFFSFNLIKSDETRELLYWPPAPDVAKIKFIQSIDFKNSKLEQNFFKKIKSFISGKGEFDELQKPFDVIIKDKNIFITCLGNPNLIKFDMSTNKFNLYNSKENNIKNPLCLAYDGKKTIYLTDSEKKAVYKFNEKNKIELFISQDLIRPTGITYNKKSNEIIIVDTGDHSIKYYDTLGYLLRIISESNNEKLFNFPTFITSDDNGNILVNDAMNFNIKLFDINGENLLAFGKKGDTPGTFSHPKGIGLDSDGHIYVVDNLFDNFQIFDKSGNILLVVGSAGQSPGQFWSPSGIDISNDTIYIADTYNNRIQVFQYLGE